MTHSLRAASDEAIFECVCVVRMVETSSDGRERVHVMFVCQVRVVGTAGYARIALNGELVFACLVYKTTAGKGLKLFGYTVPRSVVRSP